MRTVIYWALGLAGLFLVLYHYKAVSDVITASSNAISGTITKLQGGL